MRVHLGEGPDLRQVDILTVAQGNNFIKGEDQIEAVFRDLVLLQSSTVFGNLARENALKEHLQRTLSKHFFLPPPQLRWTLLETSAPPSCAS